MAEGVRDNPAIDGQEEYLEWACKICAENDLMKDSIGYCKTCDGSFCKSCLQYHDKFHKSHKVLDVKRKEDWGTGAPTQGCTGIDCSDHPGQTINMYCGLHDDVCCSVCAVLKHSEKCKSTMAFIPKIAKDVNTRREFKASMNNTDSLIERVAKEEEELAEFFKTLNVSQEQCVKDIDTVHSELENQLRELKEASLTELKRTHKDIDEAAQQCINTCGTIKQELQDMNEQMQKSTSEKNESILFIKFKKYQKLVIKCQEEFEQLCCQQKHTLEFHGNHSLLQTTQSEESLGTLVKRSYGQLEDDSSDSSDSDVANLASMMLLMQQNPGPPKHDVSKSVGSNTVRGSKSDRENEKGVLHPGIFCDGCDGSIRGTRYKCPVCFDYDLCSTCKSSGVHREHDMTKITVPTPISQRRRNNPRALHPGIICDGCDGPVRGLRFKCNVCFNYDLCEACRERGLHSQHAMKKIELAFLNPFLRISAKIYTQLYIGK